MAAVYALGRIVLDLITILGRDRVTDRAELLALRQQVRVLERQITERPSGRLWRTIISNHLPTGPTALVVESSLSPARRRRKPRLLPVLRAPSPTLSESPTKPIAVAVIPNP